MKPSNSNLQKAIIMYNNFATHVSNIALVLLDRPCLLVFVFFVRHLFEEKVEISRLFISVKLS